MLIVEELFWIQLFARARDEAREASELPAYLDDLMEWWAKDGWVGTPPDFIARTDACHTITAPEHLFFVFSFLFICTWYRLSLCLLWIFWQIQTTMKLAKRRERMQVQTCPQ